MRVVGFFLLFAGLIIVLAAIALLQETPRTGFAVAGFCVQLLGLSLALRSHMIPHGDHK